MDDNSLERQLKLAATALQSADALLIGAGAGLGVDGGLPDFRGNEGFWNAYPPFHGKAFAQISNPVWFERDPEQAWGFFGHRLHLYRDHKPHEGYEILRRWSERWGQRCMVFTSNVDGHFLRAGFMPEQVVECHGSIHHLQCVERCSSTIWPADDVHVKVDSATIRAHSPLPACPRCGGLARPNILMFSDFAWLPHRCEEQLSHYRDWQRMVGNNAKCRVVAIELGAGQAIPTVRSECETWGRPYIRINPREAETDALGIALSLGALAALRRLDALIS